MGEEVDLLWGELRVLQARRVFVKHCRTLTVRLDLRSESYTPSPALQDEIKGIVLREINNNIMSKKAQLRLLGENI